MFQKEFNDSGDFNAWHTCKKWLKEHGYSCGSTSCRAPGVGVLKGDYCIAKMHNLTRDEIKQLDGLVTGNFREGPVTLTLKAEPELVGHNAPALRPKINNGVLKRWNAQRGQRNGRGGRYKRFPSRQNLENWVVGRIIDEINYEDGRNGN